MKKQKNEILKMLALQAKMRMKDGHYDDKSQSRTNPYHQKRQELKVFNSEKRADYKLKKLDTKEERQIYQRICELLEGEEVLVNPIAHIIDKQKLEAMSGNDRIRYILGVSRKYKMLKSRYESEQEQVAL